MLLEQELIKTDVLVIRGGLAGCMAAIRASEIIGFENVLKETETGTSLPVEFLEHPGHVLTEGCHGGEPLFILKNVPYISPDPVIPVR